MQEERPFDHRQPPWSEEAELSVLGGMLINQEAIAEAIEKLNHEDFYRQANRVIFRSLQRIYQRGDAADVVTLSDELKSSGKLEIVGGMSYIAQLVDVVPSASNIEYHIKIVQNKATLRRLISEASEIISDAYGAQNDEIEEVVDRAERKIHEASSSRVNENAEDVPSILKGVLDDIEARIEQTSTVTGLRTGFASLDDKLSGMKPGQLIVMAGRPGMGKSSLMSNIACNGAIQHDYKVAIFSLEMTKNEIVERMLMSESRINSVKFRSGKFNDSDYRRLSEATGLLNMAPIHIDDTGGLTPLALRAKARRLDRRHDLDMVIVDYLQLMHVGNHQGNRQQEVSQISRSMKELAKEIEVPVIALSQLSRSCEHREDKRPILSDLRESGAIEQDADVVLFVYRPAVYKGDVDSQGRDISQDAEIIIGKQRNGPTGKIEGRFNGPIMQFEGF